MVRKNYQSIYCNKIDYLFGSVLKSKIYHGYHPEKIKYKFNIYPSHSIGFFVNITQLDIRSRNEKNIFYYNSISIITST